MTWNWRSGIGRSGAALLLGAVVLTGLAQAQGFDFQRAPGALAKAARPLHITLEIEPEFAADGSASRFAGLARLRFAADQPLPVLTLHAQDLDFQQAHLDGETLAAPALDLPAQQVRLQRANGLPIAPGEHELLLRYRGSIGRHPEGLYQITTPGAHAAQPSRMLATQMEPVGARRLLPLWDEPAYRSVYELSVVLPAGMAAVSNGVLQQREPLPPASAGGPPRERLHFAATPPMPSYLLALFAGDFEHETEDGEAPSLSAYTPSGRSPQARLALQATRLTLREYADYFAQPYPLPKLDSVALPGGFGGAMENWGAIAYHESNLLFDPETSPAGQQRRVWGFIAHEVAHQWFGNLVTMGWWDDLWLNEGFASWMGNRTVARYLPEARAWSASALHIDAAMRTDALPAAQPIRRPITSDQGVFASFDEITYQKGMALIRMLEAWLGEAQFRDGLRRYMAMHRLGNTTTADLWAALEAASGKPVAATANQWLERPGLPLVSVASRCDGGRLVVDLAQRRFAPLQPETDAAPWPIPVSLARYDAAGTQIDLHPLFLREARGRLELPGCTGTLKLNAEGSGYYRVRYDDAGLAQLAQLLPRLPEAERINLLLDANALARGGELALEPWLALQAGLAQEDTPEVWRAALEAREALVLLAEAAADTRLAAHLRARFALAPAQRLAALGIAPRPLDSEADRELRSLLIRTLGWLDHAPTVAAAQRLWADAVPANAPDSKALPGSVFEAVTYVVGRHANAAQFTQLQRLARKETDASRRSALWQALGAPKREDLARRALALARSDSASAEEAPWLVIHVAHAGHRALAWETLRRHHAVITRHVGPWGRSFFAPEVLSGSIRVGDAEALLAWTARKLGADALPEARKAADQIRNNADFAGRMLPLLRTSG